MGRFLLQPVARVPVIARGLGVSMCARDASVRLRAPLCAIRSLCEVACRFAAQEQCFCFGKFVKVTLALQFYADF